MLCRTLPKTLDLLGARSPVLLTLGTSTKEVTRTLHKATHHTNPWRPSVTHDCQGVSWVIGHRLFSSRGPLGNKNPGDYSQDPLVKEWMKELQRDFDHQPVEGKKEEEEKLGAGRNEGQEEDVSASKMEETHKEKEEQETKSAPHKVWSQLVAEKYEKLGSHTQVIYDYDEERLRMEEGLKEEEEEKEKREKVQLERGEMGVFDVEELVDLLREDNAQDLVVIYVPPELMYVDYMVIVSSASQRHRRALAELVRAAYKLKKHDKDPSVITEGKGTDWVAMDMGNIVLHIMKPETREMYDLETLWTVGAEYDEKSQISEEDLLTVRRPRDPMARLQPSPSEHTPSSEAVT